MATSPATKVAIDPDKLHAFAFKAVGDLAAAMNGPLLYIGDRLGLFKSLASSGPVTCAQLAQQTDLNERYVREWLAAMTAAQYVDYNPTRKDYSLPAEHAAVLAEENHPFFTGGLAQMIPDQYRLMPRVMECFRAGGGVPYSEYGEDTFVGTERLFRTGYINFLAKVWFPVMPDVLTKLNAGALVADIGCGRGQALFALAKEFPNSRFVGYDNYGPGVEYANHHAATDGLGKRLRFVVCNANTLPQSGDYDVVMNCDSLHDMVSPEACARSVQGMLKADGTWFVIEPNVAAELENNINPVAKLFYSVSTLQCMTCSLAHGGAGYGAGMGPKNIERVAQLAGFTRFRKLPIENPFNQFFDIRK
jgi:2-polyprenyl-3-methyl-5-hydroxy-6-metoxy-1,4-benzoquinol methylase